METVCFLTRPMASSKCPLCKFVKPTLSFCGNDNHAQCGVHDRAERWNDKCCSRQPPCCEGSISPSLSLSHTHSLSLSLSVSRFEALSQPSHLAQASPLKQSVDSFGEVADYDSVLFVEQVSLLSHISPQMNRGFAIRLFTESHFTK